ncbi:hypothetical protein SAMN05421890_3290 [Ensifer adhaerens]|nr:hypothetical protein SAMN05421890_3290 [Ensifer adhaerens]
MAVVQNSCRATFRHIARDMRLSSVKEQRGLKVREGRFVKAFSVFVAVILSATTAVAWDNAAKKVKGNDLAVETHKYDGRLIQTTANCFLADKDDIRCLAGFGARIDFSTVTGEGMSNYLFDKCDTIENLPKNICRFDIQFTYSGFSSQPTSNGSSMTVIDAADRTAEFRRYKK